MAHLVDTSVLCRVANVADREHAIAVRALAQLQTAGEVLHIAPQILIEFRAAATRPKSVNGLGFDANAADRQMAKFEIDFSLLPDTPDIFPAWKNIVSSLGIIGKQVHDARLVAVCHVHGVTHLLTFNTAHFTRMATVAPGVVVVDPAIV